MNINALSNRVPLGFLPTPVHKLTGISKLYPEYNFFIKRDDQTGLASGGNKTRKLEYLIWHAQQMGADTIITAGAQQSNHCRQTAAACAQVGMQCHLLLGGTKPDVFNGNLLLSYLLGAKIHFTGNNRKGEDIPSTVLSLQQLGHKCYVIPYGGSNAVGALGYVNAMQELSKQCSEHIPAPDFIFFASSSGGTQAGMALGNELFGIHSHLIPIAIDKPEANEILLEHTIHSITVQMMQMLNVQAKIPNNNLQLIHSFNQAGYGNMTSDEKKAIQLLAQNDGILLDPVYTGRAFAAMLSMCAEKQIPVGSNILFWHTGGLPANFVYADKWDDNSC